MEIAVIVGLGVFGNYLNKKTKKIPKSKRQELPPNETPMDTIIDSIRTEELLRAEQKRIFNDYDYSYAQGNLGKTIAESSLDVSKIKSVSDDILDNQEVVEEFANITDSTISSLTGLPAEKSHENMVPFFGSSIKQPNTFGNRIVNTFTGGYDLKGPRKTVRRFFPLQPQNIHGMPNVPYEYREKRALSQISNTVNGYAPKGTRQVIGAPYQEDIPRIHEKNVDQRRIENNPRINIPGRPTGPGESLYKERGRIGNYKKNNAPKTFSC